MLFIFLIHLYTFIIIKHPTYIENVILITSNIILDIPNDLYIKGSSSDIILAGDNVTIVCGGSVYNYLNHIQWDYPNSSQTQQSNYIYFNNNDFNFLIN